MKKLNEMSLAELYQVREIVNSVSERYAQKLTTYGIMNQDVMLEKMSLVEARDFTRRSELMKIVNKIDKLIDEKINFYLNE